MLNNFCFCFHVYAQKSLSVIVKKELYLIALAHPNASLDGVCGTIWAQRERSCKAQTSSRVLSIEGDAFDVAELEE